MAPSYGAPGADVRWSNFEIGSGQLGQEAATLGTGPSPSTPPPTGPASLPADSPPASPSRPSGDTSLPEELGDGVAESFLTPDNSFASGPFHNGLRRSVGSVDSPSRFAFAQRCGLWERQREQHRQELRWQ